MAMEIDLGRFLDVLPAMVWTALPDGHIDFVNRRWSEYMGLGLDEARKREWQAAINPDDLPQLLERWRSIVATGEPGKMETRISRFDGQFQLQQVIMDLLRKAADAMSGVDDRPRRLVIRSAPDEDDHVRLSVEDAGIGFGAEDTERLFEPFYTTKSDGMGIGLSVSRSIVESHRGRLWAASNDGPSVTFSFSIPAYLVDKPAANGPGDARGILTSSIDRAARVS